MLHRRLLPRLNLITSFSELLRGVRWFEIDVSGLSVPYNRAKMFKKNDIEDVTYK
jgi:hypothetical protein